MFWFHMSRMSRFLVSQILQGEAPNGQIFTNNEWRPATYSWGPRFVLIYWIHTRTHTHIYIIISTYMTNPRYLVVCPSWQMGHSNSSRIYHHGKFLSIVGFLKLGISKTMAFNTKIAWTDLDDLGLCPLYQWPFQEPKLEVPKYLPYIRPYIYIRPM